MIAIYEGLVIYGLRGLYEYGEFRIISYILDKNNNLVFTCLCNISLEDYNKKLNDLIKPIDKDRFIKLHTFSVALKGTTYFKFGMVIYIDDFGFDNLWLRVEYETLSKDRKPLKPIGIDFRECVSSGNPIE